MSSCVCRQDASVCFTTRFRLFIFIARLFERITFSKLFKRPQILLELGRQGLDKLGKALIGLSVEGSVVEGKIYAGSLSVIKRCEPDCSSLVQVTVDGNPGKPGIS